MIKDISSSEINTLYTITVLMLEFMSELSEKQSVFISVKKQLETEYRKNRLQNVKALNKEVVSWARQMSDEEWLQLSKLIKKETGQTLESDISDDIKKTQNIIKCGFINDEEEFRLLQDRLENIYNDENLVDEIKTIDRLLANYK